MRSTNSTLIIWIGVAVSLLLSGIAVFNSGAGRPGIIDVGDSLESLSQEELELEKLRQEIQKQQLELARMRSPWERVPAYATFITAVVAIAGVFVTIWKQIGQQTADRQQREDEALRRLDEKFTSVVADLGSDSTATRASAAVSILSFLKPQYATFHQQVLMVLLANLKLDQKDVINGLLVSGFERAVRLAALETATEDAVSLDLSRTNLYRVDLSKLDLQGADLGFARLRGANLTESNLQRLQGYEVNFENARLSRANMEEARLRKARLKDCQLHRTRLVSARLEESDLTRAEFQQAELQGAHFEKANVTSTRFEQANVADAYFRGAKFNPAALKSLVLAKNWQKAHFDADISAQLNELANQLADVESV